MKRSKEVIECIDMVIEAVKLARDRGMKHTTGSYFITTDHFYDGPVIGCCALGAVAIARDSDWANDAQAGLYSGTSASTPESFTWDKVGVRQGYELCEVFADINDQCSSWGEVIINLQVLKTKTWRVHRDKVWFKFYRSDK